ncbi:MAG: hypothetical protein HQL70_06345 [Magnetococcales bacterium]|nr:hypothetical protein [Magnetococcales bacterium]
MRRFLKIISISIAAIIISAFLLIQYLVSSEPFRQQTTQLLSKQLPGDIFIDSIEFGFFSGLELKKIKWVQQKKPTIGLERVFLGIFWSDLLHGRVAIDEIRLSGGDIKLSQAKIDELVSVGGKEQDKTKPEPASPPVIVPMHINLNAFIVDDFTIDFIISQNQTLHIKNLHLNTSLAINADGVAVQGRLGIDNLLFSDTGKKIEVPVNMEFDLNGDLDGRVVNLKTLKIALGQLLKLNLAAQVQNAMTTPAIHGTISNSEANLAPLLATIKPWLPEAHKQLAVEGTLTPKVEVTGTMTKDGFMGSADAGFYFNQLSLLVPGLMAEIESELIEIKLNNIQLSKNQPDFLDVVLNIKNSHGKFEQTKITGINTTITSSIDLAGPVFARLDLSAKQIVSANLAKAKKLHFPLTMALVGSGDFRKLSGKIEKLELEAEKLIKVSANAEATRHKGLAVSGEVNANVFAKALLDKIPQNYLQGLQFEISPKSSQINAKGRASFTPEMELLQASTEGQINSGPLSLELGEMQQKVKFNNFNMTWSGKKTLKGQLTFKEHLTLKLDNVEVAQEGSSLKLPNFTVLADASEDLKSEFYNLDSLIIKAGKMVDISGSGNFKGKSKLFMANLNLKKLALDQFGNRVVVDKRKILVESGVKGEVGATVSVQGDLQKLQIWNQRSVPLKAEINLNTKGLSYKLPHSQLSRGDLDLKLSMLPGINQRIKLKTNFLAKRVTLPEDSLPISSINLPHLSLDLVSSGTDHMTIKELKTGYSGASLSSTGTISGFHKILEQKPNKQQKIMAMIKPLFIDLKNRLVVDFDKHKALLDSQKITGQGVGELAISMLKTENGPIDFKTTIIADKISINRDDLAVKKANGRIFLHKTLIPAGTTAEVKKNYAHVVNLRPSSKVAYGKSDKLFQIEAIKVAGINIKELSGRIGLRDDRLFVHNLTLSILDGNLGGSLTVQGGKPPHIDLNLEGVGLNINELLPHDDRIKADSVVDFVSRNTLRFDPNTGLIDLGRTQIHLIITKIGRETLNQLLLYLDPTQSNPGIVSARANIGYANPSKLNFQLAQGSVKMQIDFNQGVLDSLKIDRIPISSLGSFDQIRDMLAPVGEITHLLETMGADEFDLDSDEKPLY